MYSIHFGNNYTGQQGALSQCQADAKKLRSWVKFKYQNPQTRLLLDQKKNRMLRHMWRGVKRANRAARKYGKFSLWITYSGHGSWIRDKSGDEADGRDEVLVPHDYAKKGFITDDTLARILARLDARVRCYVVMDCCHSGTVLDLPYKLSGRTQDSKHQNFKARIICISACQDSEVAYEVSTGGVLTSTLLKTLGRSKNLTLEELWAGLSKMTGQRPLLTCSKPMKSTENLFV
uniref:Peptidase C14 caspase domain-containing protein n=1 Tax=viral metagenome TaxID=1070528 RepID=A0A6C0BQH9_9ZZZZ